MRPTVVTGVNQRVHGAENRSVLRAMDLRKPSPLPVASQHLYFSIKSEPIALDFDPRFAPGRRTRTKGTGCPPGTRSLSSLPP